MPSRPKCHLATVVNIGVFSQFLIKNLIQNTKPINLRCSGNPQAKAIAEVETVVIHRFDFDVVVYDLELGNEME
jgi:hypothetical protein